MNKYIKMPLCVCGGVVSLQNGFILKNKHFNLLKESYLWRETEPSLVRHVLFVPFFSAGLAQQRWVYLSLPRTGKAASTSHITAELTDRALILHA